MKIYYHDPDSLHNKALMYFLRRAAAIVINHFFAPPLAHVYWYSR